MSWRWSHLANPHQHCGKWSSRCCTDSWCMFYFYAWNSWEMLLMFLLSAGRSSNAHIQIIAELIKYKSEKMLMGHSVWLECCVTNCGFFVPRKSNVRSRKWRKLKNNFKKGFVLLLSKYDYLGIQKWLCGAFLPLEHAKEFLLMIHTLTLFPDNWLLYNLLFSGTWDLEGQQTGRQLSNKEVLVHAVISIECLNQISNTSYPLQSTRENASNYLNSY